MRIDVCIATYRRPAWLKELLLGIAAQEFGPRQVRLRAIVVDNDPALSAAPAVADFDPRLLTIVYLGQPEKNIALTRNAALDQVDADWVAMVDDDEIVGPHWLRALVDCQQACGADVVFGPVQGRIEGSAPAWVPASALFGARRLATGTSMRWGSTNNALLRADIVRAGARFDPRLGLTGGEDTRFFYTLSQAGRCMVWCQEALIVEHIPADRATLRWVLRRHFRGGQTFAEVVSRPSGWGERLVWVIHRTGLVLVAAALALVNLPFSRGLVVRYIAKAASNLGQLSTLFAYRLEEYR